MAEEPKIEALLGVNAELQVELTGRRRVCPFAVHFYKVEGRVWNRVIVSRMENWVTRSNP